MLKPLAPKFGADLSARLKDIAEKTGPREADTDSRILLQYADRTVITERGSDVYSVPHISGT